MIVKHMVTNKARRLPKCCKHKGWTYVVAGGDLVKIGRTTGKVMTRMYGIQGASPVPITLMAVARGVEIERRLHRECSKWASHGEWFTIEAWQKIAPWFSNETRCATCVLNAIEVVKPVLPRVPLTLSANAERCGWCRHWHDPMAVCVRGSKTA